MMTSYVNGQVTAGGFSQALLDVIELRVISTLLQSQSGGAQQDELSRLRNDQAFELGISQPVPGN